MAFSRDVCYNGHADIMKQMAVGKAVKRAMDRVKRALRGIFIRPVWQTALIAPACFALLIWALCHDTPPLLDHLVYQLSVYALVISVTAALRVVPAVRRWLGRNRVLNSPFGYLVRRDADFRAWLALCLTIAWNLFYASVKLLAGALLHSTWLLLLGVYYLLLALLRLMLAGPVWKRPANLLAEWRRYRLCGAALLLMNQVLLAVVVLLLRQRGRFNYPGPLIYLMALYAFWAVTHATIRLARYHRRDDPLMSAAKAVSLTAAMVSMLSLETALITRFDEGDAAFHYVMTGAVGGVVCAAELGLALYMIKRGGEMIAQMKRAASG